MRNSRKVSFTYSQILRIKMTIWTRIDKVQVRMDKETNKDMQDYYLNELTELNSILLELK